MIDGNLYKKEMEDEMLNINDISFTITENNLIIESIFLDLFYDEIEEEVGEKIENFYDWGNDLRYYIKEKNFFKIVVEKPADLTIDNITHKLRVGLHETWICLCEFARGEGVFKEPDDGILI